jgi:hypothetical protein
MNMRRARTRTLILVMVLSGLAFGALAAIVTSTILENHSAIDLIEREGRERRDQSCMLSERQHLQDVIQLRRTYRYLVDPEKFGDRKGSDLYNVVLAQLGRTERQARIDRAPQFCDEPGIGLREPDPRIPQRPFGI